MATEHASSPPIKSDQSPPPPSLGRKKAFISLGFGIGSLSWAIVTIPLILLLTAPALLSLLSESNAQTKSGTSTEASIKGLLVFGSTLLAIVPTLMLPLAIIGLFLARSAHRLGTRCLWAIILNSLTCLVTGLAILLAIVVFLT